MLLGRHLCLAHHATSPKHSHHSTWINCAQLRGKKNMRSQLDNTILMNNISFACDVYLTPTVWVTWLLLTHRNSSAWWKTWFFSGFSINLSVFTSRLSFLSICHLSVSLFLPHTKRFGQPSEKLKKQKWQKIFFRTLALTTNNKVGTDNGKGKEKKKRNRAARQQRSWACRCGKS